MSGAIVKRDAGTLRQMLEGDKFKEAIKKALPIHLKPDRFIRVALTTMMRTPKLAQCDQASFFNALLTLSQLGIEPDGRRAHLIPFENRNRGVTECQLIIDYKGLAELAMRSGVVANLHADVVCENDAFEYDRGQLVRHMIDFRRPRGSMIAAYALCRFKDGTEKAEVMSKEDVDAIRKRSRAGNAGPWVSDYNEMAKKTAFRRLSKWLPLSAEFRDALDVDDEELPRATVTADKPSSLVEVVNFDAAEGAIEDAPQVAQDEEAEADAGLAPEPPKAKPAPKREAAPKAEEQAPQDKLKAVVESAGFTFGDLQKWGLESGNIPDADSITDWTEIKGDIAQRLLRATGGLLKGLQMTKGGAA